nr:Vps5 C-terminal domain containing protein [Haemonchus contortus]
MDEAVRRMDQLEAEFGEISKLIREEIGRFEVQRRHDMRQLFIEYLESLVQTHTEQDHDFLNSIPKGFHQNGL